MQIEELYNIFLSHPSVQTDTRKIQPGDLFFALKGPNFNGNAFALKAFEAGASYVVVDEETGVYNNAVIRCENVLETLQALAKYHRQQFNIPVLAITGSNGKTTTKELINEVLRKKFKTYTTKGNLNNHIGVPLTLLSIQKDATMAVIEMGANHQQEIASYCAYTLPTHGVITNCGKAHLEGFGGIMGVRKGKGELYDFIRENNGTVFLFNDLDYLSEMAVGIKNIITYGAMKDAEVIGKALDGEMLSVQITRGLGIDKIHTHLVGDYNLSNVLVAVTVGKYFGVPEQDIVDAIENYIPSNSRSQLIQKGTNKIILDAYNANPSSMKLAIENIAQKYSGKKVLLLGGMMEMGENSIQEHAAIIQLIENYSWDNVVLVGGDFESTHKGFVFFKDVMAAREWFKLRSFDETTLLIKGSRSMQMEKILT
jgi:UDP-N-acetylmuramoyl-tripeptide--D-alanyl-D-alanine ligase